MVPDVWPIIAVTGLGIGFVGYWSTKISFKVHDLIGIRHRTFPELYEGK